MTKEYAAIQLLRHGALELKEFQCVTGWKYNACRATLGRLRNKSAVKLLRSGAGKRSSIYELAA